VLETIDKGLEPHKPKLRRVVTQDDIVSLTEIKIKRISKFDAFKADEYIRGLEASIAEVEHHLANITAYATAYFQNLLKKYGKGRERRTEITEFDAIVATEVAVANQKLYVNWQDGFAGYGMKKDEYVCNCSDIDDIIVFRRDGTFLVTRVAEKVYVGKDILHIAVFRKNDEQTTYNMIYQDGPKGNIMMKRFNIEGITRDKEYNLTKGTPGSKVLYFSVTGPQDREVVTVHHKPMPRLKKLVFDEDLSLLGIKGRSSMGNILTRNPVNKIVKKKNDSKAPATATAPVPAPAGALPAAAGEQGLSTASVDMEITNIEDIELKPQGEGTGEQATLNFE
jgi:topoisomerase IV subunit A